MLKTSQLWECFALGIHSPLNLHSFQSQIHVSLMLDRCQICSGTILPLATIGRCLKCGFFVHRQCVSACHYVCTNVCLTCAPNTAPPPRTDLSPLDAEYWRNMTLALNNCSIDRDVFVASRDRDIDATVYAVLRNACAAPGFLCSVMQRSFLEMHFQDCESYIRAAKQMLECCCNVVLKHCAGGDDNDLARSVVIATKRYIMMSQNRAVQKIVWKHIRHIASSLCKDGAVRRPLKQTQELDAAIARQCRVMVECVTAEEKLSALVHLLQMICAQSSSPSPPDDNSRPIGADELLQRLVHVVGRSVWARLPEIDWRSECLFMTMMAPASDGLLGAEGYSLTSLRQALLTMKSKDEI